MCIHVLFCSWSRLCSFVSLQSLLLLVMTCSERCLGTLNQSATQNVPLLLHDRKEAIFTRIKKKHLITKPYYSLEEFLNTEQIWNEYQCNYWINRRLNKLRLYQSNSFNFLFVVSPQSFYVIILCKIFLKFKILRLLTVKCHRKGLIDGYCRNLQTFQ